MLGPFLRLRNQINRRSLRARLRLTFFISSGHPKQCVFKFGGRSRSKLTSGMVGRTKRKTTIIGKTTRPGMTSNSKSSARDAESVIRMSRRNNQGGGNNV